MKIILKIFILFLLSVETVALYAQKTGSLKPQWLTKELPRSSGGAYLFVDAMGTNTSLEGARQNCFVNLTTKIEHERGIVVNSYLSQGSRTTRESGERKYSSYKDFSMECSEKGKEIVLNCRVIDEYWECKNGQYYCYILYTIADYNAGHGSYDDEIVLTTHYGMQAFVRSLIPGWGQMYKGSTIKGLCILGGEVVCIGGIIVSESLRSSYVKKMKEQPKFAKNYGSKADNWENGRNFCIGAAAALYVYNLIDAIAAKGAKRVIVKPAGRPNFSLAPTVMDNGGCGLAFTYRF